MRVESDGPALTRRERAVLEALCRPAGDEHPFGGPASVREIAQALYVSEAAVKQHLLHLYDKFEVWDQPGPPRRVLLANEVVRRGVLGRTASASDLDAGRCALASQEWDEAFRLLSGADRVAPLSAADLEGLGEASMWALHDEESVAARTRAHAVYVTAGDARGAARTAIALAANHFARLRLAVVGGWLAKAASLVPDDDCPEAGVAGAFIALVQALSGETEQALERARRAQEIGRRVGSADAQALGLVVEGVVLVRCGRLAEGNARLDEAMASAAAGELSPMATAIVYCRTISTCLDVFDFTRAQEWTDEVARLQQRTTVLGFPGDCATHQAALHLVSGRWGEGEEVAGSVCGDGAALELSHTISATITLGEVRLRQGDYEGAATAFTRVLSLGGVPEPGRSLLQLASGDAAGAALSIKAALDGSLDRLARARLLPAQVRIALAGGDHEVATAASAELAEIAAGIATPALQAAAAQAEGALDLARGRPLDAVGVLRLAVGRWSAANTPYEAAQSRLLLGQALGALGDASAAETEVTAGAGEFQRLGARPDADAARSLAYAPPK